MVKSQSLAFQMRSMSILMQALHNAAIGSLAADQSSWPGYAGSRVPTVPNLLQTLQGTKSLATSAQDPMHRDFVSVACVVLTPRKRVQQFDLEPQQQMRAHIDVTHEPDLSKVPLACELSSWRLRDRALRRAGAHLVLVGTAETDKDELEDAPVPIIFNVCNQALVNAKRAGFHEVRDGIDNYSTDIATHHWLETDSSPRTMPGS